MHDPFKALFADAGLDDATIERLAGEFMSIAFLALLGASKDRFTEAELAEIHEAWSGKRFDDVAKKLQATYKREEWDPFIKSTVGPLAKSYLETVVQGKAA